MDISKASNLERFIFDLLGRDGARLVDAWHKLDSEGELDLTSELSRFESEFGIVSGTSTHADRVETIRSVHSESGVIIDPHTADGVKVAREYVEKGIPMLVLETAKPTKFADIVTEATGEALPLPTHLTEMLQLPQYVTDMQADGTKLREFISQYAVTRTE